MKKSYADSNIEIWSQHEINNPDIREKENRNIMFLQIETGSTEGNYIVEYLRLDEEGELI